MSRPRPGRRIALAGPAGSGKTVLLTVFLHELGHRLGRQLDLAIGGADDRTLDTFDEVLEGPLYRGFTLPPSASEPGASLSFRLTTPARHPSVARLPSVAKRPRHTELTFVDVAGAELEAGADPRSARSLLADVDGLVLVLDPAGLRDGRSEPARLLERVASAAGKTARARTSLAVVVSKVDLLRTELPATSVLRRPPPSARESDGEEVHAEVGRWLSGSGAGPFDEIARQSFRRHRYFGVSALGEPPAAGNEVSRRGIRPYRAGDPILWILAGFGAVPAARRR